MSRARQMARARSEHYASASHASRIAVGCCQSYASTSRRLAATRRRYCLRHVASGILATLKNRCWLCGALSLDNRRYGCLTWRRRLRHCCTRLAADGVISTATSAITRRWSCYVTSKTRRRRAHRRLLRHTVITSLFGIIRYHCQRRFVIGTS